ncbi:MAG: heat-shock protein Hsp20 [Caulobacteraceae bacterium]|nr:heat-shock protein Hsp20 [Caulobacteraceae bacterium]
MNRTLYFDSPFLVGFEQTRDLLERLSRAGEGYPPYNIEQTETGVRLSFAVAGFSAAELDVTLENNQLTVAGRREPKDEGERAFLHRGIAARSFSRSFVLAAGMTARGASLEHGLLNVDLDYPTPDQAARRIPIQAR